MIDITTPTRPAAQPGEALRLVLDEAALRKQFRHAFAADFTVVQELVQNARRAGATRVTIDYDAGLQELTVTDDGSGIEDFRHLLTYASSGWNADIAAAERPYGMGFMAAIYAAKRVTVTSRGQRLSFDTETMLKGGSATIEPSGDDSQVGTQVCLERIALHQPFVATARLARGYPIPLVYEGKELERKHAIDSTFAATEVGHIRLGATAEGGFTAYLQGFKVYESDPYPTAVVHLDGSRYFGKFPDRDRVINEDRMVADVMAALKRLHTERLDWMKRQYPPVDFCRAAYDLAAGLNRLDVFNDVPCLPSEWFATLAAMPKPLLEGEEEVIEYSEGNICRRDIESGSLMVGPDIFLRGLDGIKNTGHDTQLRLWIFAYLAKQPLLMKRLHRDHWIHEAMEAADQEVAIQLDVAHDGRIDSQRTSYIGGTRILACTRLEMQAGRRRLAVDEPVALIHDGEPCLLVPRSPGPPIQTSSDWCWIGRDCLRQFTSYKGDDDMLEEADLETDEAAANHALDLLVSATPHEYLQRVMSAALHPYRDELKRFAEIHLELDDGVVSVKSFGEFMPDDSAPF